MYMKGKEAISSRLLMNRISVNYRVPPKFFFRPNTAVIFGTLIAPNKNNFLQFTSRIPENTQAAGLLSGSRETRAHVSLLWAR